VATRAGRQGVELGGIDSGSELLARAGLLTRRYLRLFGISPSRERKRSTAEFDAPGD